MLVSSRRLGRFRMPLLAPILAQIVTLGAGDRVESRYVISKSERYFESTNSTGANAGLTWRWKRASLSLAYQPSLDVVPLIDTPREVTLNHNAHLTGDYRWRLTTLCLGVSASYGERDLRRELTAPRQPIPGVTTPAPATSGNGQDMPGTTPNPTPTPGSQPTPGATPGTSNPDVPTTTTPAILDIARLGSLRFGGGLSHTLGRNMTLGFSGGYSLSGGVDDESRAVYPIVPSADAGASFVYELDGRNTFSTGLSNQISWTTDTTTYLATLSESWTHRFSRRTTGSVNAGIAYSRTMHPDFPTLHGIYPVGGAGIGHSTRLAHGMFSFGANVSTAPVMDLTTGAIDPRLAAGLGVGWTRDRFSASASLGSSVSLTPSEEGALSNLSSNVGVSYDIGLGFAADAGVRETWQRFQGVTLVEPTTVFYGGLSWSGGVELNKPRKP